MVAVDPRGELAAVVEKWFPDKNETSADVIKLSGIAKPMRPGTWTLWVLRVEDDAVLAEIPFPVFPVLQPGPRMSQADLLRLVTKTA